MEIHWDKTRESANMGAVYFRQKLLRRMALILGACVFFSLGAELFGLGTSVRLAPPGLKLLKEQIAKYPKFDKRKCEQEAAKRFPLVKKGTKVTVVYRNQQASGTFNGCHDNYVVVGSTQVPMIDMAQAELAKFVPKINEEERAKYVAKLKAAYKSRKRLVQINLIEKLKAQYPPVSKQSFLKIFSKLDDKALADKCITDLVDMYNKNLPIPEGMSQKQFLRDVFYKFMATRKDIVLDGVYVISIEEKRKREAARRKMEEARRAKLKARIIYPRVATPEFSPDGGAFEENLKIKILCSTPGAVIHYTINGDTPTEKSPVYKEPLAANLRMRLKAVAFHPLFNDSDIACMDAWTCSGLLASYFNRCCFTGKTVCRLDKSIAMRWRGGASDKLPKEINLKYFSVLWAGQLVAPETGTYTFYLSGDDGVRMWLDGKMFIDGWKEQSKTSYNAEVKLEAGKRYDIKLALVNLTGSAMITLEWKPPGESRQIVPANCLVPEGRSVAIIKKWNELQNGKYIYRKKLKNIGNYKGKVLPWSFANKAHKVMAEKQLHVDWTTP